jgi:hypothetical protein
MAELEALLKQFAVERACVASSLAIMGDLEHGNRSLAQEIESRQFFLGYAVINPNFTALSMEEMKKYLPRADFCGAKIHSAYNAQPLNSPATKQLVKALLRFDKPLFVHARNPGDLQHLAETAGDYPSATFIVAEMGGSAWPAAVALADRMTNVILDCGGSVADRDKLKYAVDTIGANRLIFGSNCPLVHPAFGMGMVRDAEVEANAKERILNGNARRIFKL